MQAVMWFQVSIESTNHQTLHVLHMRTCALLYAAVNYLAAPRIPCHAPAASAHTPWLKHGHVRLYLQGWRKHHISSGAAEVTDSLKSISTRVTSLL